MVSPRGVPGSSQEPKTPSSSSAPSVGSGILLMAVEPAEGSPGAGPRLQLFICYS